MAPRLTVNYSFRPIKIKALKMIGCHDIIYAICVMLALVGLQAMDRAYAQEQPEPPPCTPGYTSPALQSDPCAGQFHGCSMSTACCRLGS